MNPISLILLTTAINAIVSLIIHRFLSKEIKATLAVTTVACYLNTKEIQKIRERVKNSDKERGDSDCGERNAHSK